MQQDSEVSLLHMNLPWNLRRVRKRFGQLCGDCAGFFKPVYDVGLSGAVALPPLPGSLPQAIVRSFPHPTYYT
eukprot:1707228-Amphidinium_carterae.1